MKRLVWILFCGLLVTAGAGGASEADAMLDVKMDEPVVVALSKPGETRWGHHQFPALSRRPDGQIQLIYSNSADAVGTYGDPDPGYVSNDGGKTWTPFDEPDFLRRKPHLTVFEAGGGEFLCVPPVKPLNLKAGGLKLPAQTSSFFECGAQFELYRFAECPKPVQDFIAAPDAWRWTPAAKAWSAEKIRIDTRGLLAWKTAKTGGPDSAPSTDLPRAWFEHPPVQVGNELVYAEYRTMYQQPDGALPANMNTVCIVSADRGKTWQWRGLIAAGKAKQPMCEPMLAPTSDGGLACVLRTDPGPLVIAFSRDGGRTWSAPAPLHKFGVFPGLILLENGVLVVSFGRPGVHVKFSPDGKGTQWTEPAELIPATGKWNERTCGYTALLAGGKDEFLIAYSDFQHKDAQGRTCKAILVRRIQVKPTEGK